MLSSLLLVGKKGILKQLYKDIRKQKMKTTLALSAVPLLFACGLTSAATFPVSTPAEFTSAIQNAQIDDTIVVESDDTFLLSTSLNKSLTVKAGEGFSPTFKGEPGFPAFTISGSTFRTNVLTLEGITVDISDSFIDSDFGFEFERGGSTLVARSGSSEEFYAGLALENSTINGGMIFSGTGSIRNLVVVSTVDSDVNGFISLSGTGNFSTQFTSTNSTIQRVSVGGTGNAIHSVDISESTLVDGISYGGTGSATSTGLITNSTIGSVSISGISSRQDDLVIEDSRITGGVSLRVTSREPNELTIRRSRIEGAVRVESRNEGNASLNISNSIVLGESATGSVGIETREFGQVQAVNVTVANFGSGILSRNEEDTFTNMLLVNNGSDIGQLADTDSVSYSLISDGGIAGVVGVNNNISGAPLLDDALNLLAGSLGIDAGNNFANGVGEIDLYGETRIFDGDQDGVAQVDVGASEVVELIIDSDGDGIEDGMDNCPITPNADQSDVDGDGTGDVCDTSDDRDNVQFNNSIPVVLNSWGSGFNATFEYRVQESDTAGGTLREWRVEVETSGAAQISNAWINSGYNASISSRVESGVFVITNESQSYIPELVAGDVITFTIQGNGDGFASEDVNLSFFGLSQTLPATGTCENPTPVSLPFSFDGQGEFCWVVSESVSRINSWNTESVSINGEDFSNRWSNSLPSPVNGELTIIYNGNFAWSHFEMSGS